MKRNEVTQEMINAKLEEIKPFVKKGWHITNNEKKRNGIIKGVYVCDGDCPCDNHSEDKHCCCSGYRLHNHCCCGLIVKDGEE